jgi:uncharacterized protein (TIGR00299 family) protein
MLAYLDLPSGLSGDMFLACLLDAGWPPASLRRVLEQMELPSHNWSVQTESVMRGPLRAMLVHVQVQEGGQHRHLSDVRRIIEAARLPAPVVRRAVGVFTRLAEAEAAVHGIAVEDVHFHEVGALDAIVDIVGVCAGLHELGVTALFASAVPLGEGWVNSAHGRIPAPAPATLALLARVNAPTRPAPGPGELLTPTGAALLAEFATFQQPHMHLQRIGVGAGQKDFSWPNVARLMLGEPVESGSYVQIETNIDDMNPELYAAVSQSLFAAGALDVWFTPIQMKKGRPGVLFSVLAPAGRETALAGILLRETTTLGVRVHAVHRHEARRTFAAVQTDYGEIQVKLKWIDDAVAGAKPEYEDCLRVAQARGVPVRLVYEAAAHEALHLTNHKRSA